MRISAYTDDRLPQAGPPHASGCLGGGRLLVVSNRAPVEIKRARSGTRVEQTIGGLVSGLQDALRKHGGTWIAWAGSEYETRDGVPERIGIPRADPRFTLRCVRLSEREVSQYYYGFSNRALWPLAHYFLERCHFDRAQWNEYCRANERFAAAICEEAGDDDVVWVQDFHLTLTPAIVRLYRPRLRLGFFWHIPFPDVAVFGVLPWRRDVLWGMLGSDAIGFHLPEYTDNFLSCCEQILGLPVDRETRTVDCEGRPVRVVALPIGIDFGRFDALARSPRVRARARRLRKLARTPKIVLGVDRLDYTKGITARLRAFERFIERYPEYRRRVTFIQVAVPSRTRVEDYRRMKREIDEAVGRIGGRFASLDWTPIRYLYSALPKERLTAHYAAADVALVTPLRDGMNLVAKEYAASRTEEDGVLVLSEFAGAAQALTDAVRVNPFDVEQTAERLREAIEMDPQEQRRRMRRLREEVRARDLHWWVNECLRSFAGAAPATALIAPSPPLREGRC